MIRVALDLARNGTLRRLDSSGHATGRSDEDHGDADPAGRFIACAAVSALLRSAARLLAAERGVLVEGSAPGPGELTLQVRRVALGRRRYVRGVTDVLLQGLRDVREDYPNELEIEM